MQYIQLFCSCFHYRNFIVSPPFESPPITTYLYHRLSPTIISPLITKTRTTKITFLLFIAAILINMANTNTVLSSQYLQDTYFDNCLKKPLIQNVDNGTGHSGVTWTFSRDIFDYFTLIIPIQTSMLISDVFDVDDNLIPGFPHGVEYSAEFIKYFVTNQQGWPSWIPLKYLTHKVLSINDPNGQHCIWYCCCKLFAQQDNPECVHWEHNREGGITQFDIEMMNLKKKPTEIWQDDIDSTLHTLKHKYCNTDGHFKNINQVTNMLKNYVNHEEVDDVLQVFDEIGNGKQYWISKLLQQGLNYKRNDIVQADRRGLEWNYVGWYAVQDILNTCFAIYSAVTCDPLWQYPNAFPDGIFIEDMANLITNIWGRKLCHTIAFVRNTSGRLPLTIFEFISGDWTQCGFEFLLYKWWSFVRRCYDVKITAFCTDWDRKLQNGICYVINRKSIRKYLEITHGIAS
eukprot:329214_1